MRFCVLSLFLTFALFVSSQCEQQQVGSGPSVTAPLALPEQVRTVYTLPGVGVYASNRFDGARLSGLVRKNDSTALAIINPENEPINKSPYYAFDIWSDKAQVFYIIFQYPEGYTHRYIPKLETDGRWQVADSSQLSKTSDGLAVLKLKLDRSPTTVAAQEIHDSNDVLAWATRLIEGKKGVQMKNIGKSVLGREIPVFDISTGSDNGKDVIVLLTRQHPPELTGYYAFQYFLSTLLNESPLSKQFLSRYHILAFPLMNPDGVDEGHWRHNAGGTDLNRDWSGYRQPEVRQVVAYIDSTVKSNHARLVLGIDFHSTWHDVFYTNKEREGTALPHFLEEWFAALEQHITHYSVNEQAAKSTRPVSKSWFLDRHGAVGITYEVGDETPRDSVELISRVAAQQMQRILLKE